MVDVTLSGGSGGQVSLPFDSQSQAALAQSVLGAIAGNQTVTYTPGSNLPPATGSGTTLVIDATPSAPITLPAGYDGLVIRDGMAATVTGGGGDGQVVLAGSGGLTFNTGGGSATIVAAGGNNLIGTTLGGDEGSRIALGAGNDTVVAWSGDNT